MLCLFTVGTHAVNKKLHSLVKMCLSNESFDTDDEKICPICYEAERKNAFSRICTPGNLNPAGIPRCDHRICEVCVIKLFFSQMHNCPFCRESWKPYFTEFKKRFRKFNDALCDVVFHEIVVDETNEYVPRCRRLLNQCGREYCLAILGSDIKRAMYSY